MTYNALTVGAVLVGAVLVGLHGLDVYLARRDKARADQARKDRRAALLATLGKAPPAPGTMQRRYTDLAGSLPEDGDEGAAAWPREW